MNFLIRLVAVGVHMHSSGINMTVHGEDFIQAQLSVEYAFTLFHLCGALSKMILFDLEFQRTAW